MNETIPKISVIVPVYKAEAYLHRCVDSLLAQSFQHFEILLIDDGSPDRSGEICDEYARKDKRVRVFHKENGGVSSARNVGLDNAKGEWVTFVDSDDYVTDTYLNDFGLKQCDAEIYLQGYQIFRKGKQDCYISFQVEHVKIIPFYECFWEGEFRVIINYPWGKLFNLSIIKKYALTFDVSISYGEDHLFVLSYLNHICRTAVSPTSSYNYVCDGNGSLSTRVVPLDELFYYAEQTYKLQVGIMQDHVNGEEYFMKAIQKRIYSNIIITLRNFYFSDFVSWRSFSTIRTFYKNKFIIKYIGIPFYQQCLLWLFLNLPTIMSYHLFALYVHIRMS